MRKIDSRKQLTHQRLLDAASHAFAEHGYERASVNHIIERASSSKGAFYHHFDSKEAVFLELMDQRLQAQRDALKDAMVKGQVGSLEELLSRSVDVGFHVYKNRDWAPLYMEFWAYATRSETLTPRIADLYRKWRAYLSNIIEMAQEGGVISTEINPAKAAGILIAIFEGMHLQLLVEEDALTPGDVVALVVRMLSPADVAGRIT